MFNGAAFDNRGIAKLVKMMTQSILLIVPHYETVTNNYCAFYMKISYLEVADYSNFIRFERGIFINL